jgi:hypothetical protein
VGQSSTVARKNAVAAIKAGADKHAAMDRPLASETRDNRRTLMISLGLLLAATGIVAVSFESFGAALVLFGIAGLLIRSA